MWQLEEHFNCIQIGEKNEKYYTPIIKEQKINIEEILAASSKFEITDSDPLWDGDIFGAK